MSYDTEADAIRARFNTSWGATTPIAWPNVNFTPPAGEPWVRLTIRSDEAFSASLPAPTIRHRHTGMVVVQVFTPDNEGDAEARTLADQVCAIFRDVTAGGITYRGVDGSSPYVTEVGPDGSGWYQLNVWVPYYRDSLF